MVFEQDAFILAKYWVNPGTPVPTYLKDCSWDVKNQIKQTKPTEFQDGSLYILRFKNVPQTIVFLSLKIELVLANSADPDEMLHNAAFHLGLHLFAKIPI